MDQKNYNTVTIPDLFWKVLSRWWVIVIFAVIGVLAIYKLKIVNYDSDLQTYEDTRRAYNLQMQDYYEQMDFYNEYRGASDRDENSKASMADKLESFCRSRLNDEQLAVVDNAMNIRQLIEDTRKFQDNAIVMKLDPYNIPALYVIYQITPENWDWVNGISQYYTNANSSNVIWSNVIEQMGWSESLDCNLLSGCMSMNFVTGGQMAYSFYYNDASVLEAVSAAIDGEVNRLKDEINAATGMTHTVSVIESNIYNKADSNVASTQNTYQQWQTGYYNQLNGLINTMNGVKPMINLYNSMENRITGGNGYITLSDPTMPAEPEMGKAPYGKKIMLAVGAVIGIILGIIFLLLCMIFGTRVQKIDGLETYCGMTLLGVVFSERFCLPFEKLVRRLRNRRLGSVKQEERLALAAEKIAAVYSMTAGKTDRTDNQGDAAANGNGAGRAENKNQLVVSGTAVMRNSELLKKLSERLAAKGIEVIAIGNLLESPEVFSKAVESGAVVFVEQEISSKYGRIQREQQMAAGCGIKVLGTVGIV